MKKKILLVEDQAELRENIQEILEISGFYTAVANNGVEALQLLEKATFDLVISDIMMPEMDGFMLLQNFREKEYWLETPFIFLTAKMEYSNQRMGMEAGAEDYLIKPVKAKELISAVNTALKKKEKRAQAKALELKNIFGQQRGVFFHEMVTPLTGVIAALELLKEFGQTLPPEDFNLFVGNALNASRRLDTSLKKLRRFQNIDLLQVNLQNHPSIEESLKDFIKTQVLERELKITIHHDFSFMFTSTHLHELLAYLLNNAQKFSPVDSLITLEIFEKTLIIRNEQQVIQNLGAVVPKPFQQFAREKEEQQGLGLGMFLAERLAFLNKASLKFEVKENLIFEAKLSFTTQNY
ncbi:MAG: hybrid sensor histidine kinase/response regulator [Mongoliitalea sp.]